MMIVREHHAPVGALRRPPLYALTPVKAPVREHHAPVGALRPVKLLKPNPGRFGQGAPRTCRCIETMWRSSQGKPGALSGSTTHL